MSLEYKMTDFSDSHPRRRFVGRAAAALAALSAGVPTVAHSGVRFGSEQSEHDAWMAPLKGKHRQIFHGFAAAEAPMLMAANFLDSYAESFGAKSGEVNAVVGVHGPALTIGFTDAAWAKYSIGKSVSVTDSVTKEPAVRNIFRTGGPLSVEALQKRGVVFIMCNNALKIRSRAFAAERGEPYETVYEDLKSSRIPGTILVPALVIALNRAQEAGFSYVRA